MKVMILAIGMISVLLVAGGGAAYYLFGMKKPEQQETKVKTAPAEPPPVFGDPLRLEQIGLPLVSDKRYAGYVLFQSAYVVPKEKLEATKAKMPFFQDAIIRELNRRPLKPENSDENEIKRRLMAIAEQVYGPKVVYEIQLQRLSKTN